MSDIQTLKNTILKCLENRKTQDVPYRHWFVNDCLPEDDAKAVAELPFPVPEVDDTEGRRETHNSLRQFFSAENRERHPVVKRVTDAFQSPEIIRAIEAAFDVSLAGNYLRIEYCQDGDNFWLEPHTDIGAKKFTMLVGYTTHPDGEGWGTSIYYDKDRFYGQAQFGFNKGLVFIPSDNTWHGFEKRPMHGGVRRSIIINYVIPEWRSRHELAFPNDPVQ